MSLSLSEIESDERPAESSPQSGWLRGRRARFIAIAVCTLVAVGAWQFIVAVQKLRIVASRTADT